MADLSTKAEHTTDAVMGFVVVLAIIGGTIALVFTNLGSTILAFTDPNTGNDTLDTIIQVLALPLGLTVVFGIIKLVKKSTSAGGK